VPEFEVKVNEGYENFAELCGMYWTTNEDGSFTYAVKSLGEHFGHPTHKVSQIVGEACFARSASRRCSGCNRGFTYRSRAEWTSSARYGAMQCHECREEERLRQTEQRERIEASKRTTIIERFVVTTDDPAPSADDLDMPTAFALAALLEDAEEVAHETTVPVVRRIDRLTPTPDYDRKLLDLLIDLGLLRVHPSSPLESFAWSEDGTLENSYYPRMTSYYLTGSGTLQSRIEGYLKSFGKVVSRESWPERWVDQFPEFWFDVAVSECKAYLVHMLKIHGMEFTPGQKTDDVFRRALKWYSIGQVYYFIYRAAQYSAAYLARERISAKQAANSAITKISGDIDRAYEQGWQVKTYGRDTRLPLSTLSHILFSRALKLDNPMTYSPINLPARRPGLELAWENIDSKSFERLIFQILVETEGYENVDWLTRTNAPDHGLDVRAVRLRRDPLSGQSSQRVAIQCKHWLTQSVRDIDVSAAIVSIEHWQNPPFDVLVIATSGRFTTDAVAWIERHNSQGKRPSIEVWNDARLEVFLNERPHLIRAYGLR
jgi:hypothetical protein